MIFSLCLLFSQVSFAATKISALKIVESYTLPIVEISGLAWRVDPTTKKKQMVIVSDREFKIYLADWEKRKTGFDLKAVKIEALNSKKEKQSDWESVFSDESGRIFIVKEHPTQLIVVNPELNAIEATLDLKVSGDGKAAETWNLDDNSKGEGFLPLKNGHILVVKEKNPLSIMEFAPTGEKSKGYEKKSPLDHTGLFPLMNLKDASLTSVASWQFDSEVEALLEDGSGLNVDKNGMLYLLGDQKNIIVKIGNSLKASKERLKAKRVYSLPSAIKQPEGMVFTDGEMPIIAMDSKKTNKPNLFLLSAFD